MNPVLDSIDLYFDKIKKIYLSKKTFNKFNKTQLKKINNLPIIYISEGDFKNLTQSNNHQSIAAEIKIDSVNMLDDLKKKYCKLRQCVDSRSCTRSTKYRRNIQNFCFFWYI